MAARAAALIASASREGSRVLVTLHGGGPPLSLPVPWLWASAPAHHDEHTNQRSLSAVDASRAPPLESVAVAGGGARLEVAWGGGRVLGYDARWLAARAPCAARLAAAAAAAAPPPLSPPPPPPQFSHDALQAGGDAAALALLRAVNRAGVALVRGCPTADPRAVLALCARLAPPMRTIYGDTWAVEVPRGAPPINVAYTDAALSLHQDLAYYESPPGLQLLLCREFDAAVEGGESTFLDGLAAGEALRASAPAAFATLARVPATFQKVHYARAEPAHMEAQRPIFTLGAGGALTGVTWAPQFEGPLRVPAEDVAPFFEAYAQFAALLAAAEAGRAPGLLQLRLQKGDALVFNQRRMLHGRRAFKLPPGGGAQRSLQGCYANACEWKSRLRVLERRLAEGGGEGEPLLRCGDGQLW
jgi:alpha-ketoglutarate-dependent taurine dioxygenase